MKKTALFLALAVLVSLFSVGCTSDGSSGCRLGSFWPTSRSRQANETVYLGSGTSHSAAVSPCREASACNPCEAACSNPCEPACNPCDMNCGSTVINTGISSHAVN